MRPLSVPYAPRGMGNAVPIEMGEDGNELRRTGHLRTDSERERWLNGTGTLGSTSLGNAGPIGMGEYGNECVDRVI